MTSGTNVDDENPSVVIVETVNVPTCTKAEFDPETVNAGGMSTFSWMTDNTNNAVQLQCNGAGVNVDEAVEANGNQKITVPTTANAGDMVTCTIVKNDVSLCSDKVTVVADPAGPAIEVLKWAANPDDQDGVTTGDNAANDTQTVNSVDPNDVAVFNIRVENTGNVDLEDLKINDANAPECALTDAQVDSILQNGTTTKATISNIDVTGLANNDLVFNVGEFFTYTCTQDGVRDSYTNIAEAVAVSVDNPADIVRDEDPTEVVVCNLVDDGTGTPVCPIVTNPNPSIEIVKTDKNPADFDNGDPADSQLIVQGANAVFEITVTNNGNEALENVVITDSESPACARIAAETLGLYPGSAFDPGETFTYECTKENAQPGDFDGNNGEGSVDGHNDIGVEGEGVVSGTDVEDQDPSEVKFFPICTPEQGTIVIDKDDSTPGQPDQDGNDTQVVGDGGTAEFTITVTNTGTTAVSNVTVADTLSPNCAKTAAEFLALLGGVGNNDAVFDGGEAVTYTCTQDNVTADFTNSATVTGIVNQHDCAVTDTDTTEVVVNGTGGFCGDGVVQAPEECDNGALNGTAGNACSSTCSTGGGGSSDTNPSVGTCSNHSVTGAAQCVRKKPVEDVSDPLWQSYRRCKAGETAPRHTGTGLLLEELCALDWAEDQGLDLCGPVIAGVKDPFGTISAAEGEAQCGGCIGNSCGGGCTGNGCYPTACVEAPVDCPGCFKTGTDIVKTAVTETVSNGERATYEIRVNLNSFDTSQYEILRGHIRVYDMVIPTESGHMWGREGIIDGDDNETWTWCGNPDNAAICGETQDYFRLDLQNDGYNYVSEINTTGQADLLLPYDLDSRVASKYDATQIKNVAYAVVYYEYEVLADNTRHQHVAGIGERACESTPVIDYYSGSSVGSTATVNIIRPFIKARAGNAGYYGGGEDDKAFGDQGSTDWNAGTLDPSDFNYGLTLTDDPSLYTGAEQGDAGTFADFQEQQEAFYDNLNDAAAGLTTVPGTLRSLNKLPDTNVYQIEGNLNLSELNGMTESATFIVNNGDVLAYSDFTLASDVFAAFIIRDGDLLIETNVTELQGMYLVEQGEVKSAPEGDISDVQLKVSGNLYGNLGHLLAYRRYIGTASDIEPSIEINFDLRLLDNTPPMLEQFLGDGWREEVQG